VYPVKFIAPTAVTAAWRKGEFVTLASSAILFNVIEINVNKRDLPDPALLFKFKKQLALRWPC
jgi:hypothetical protein